MNARATRGTTLVELLVVLTLVGLLTQASIPDYGRAFETRRLEGAESVLLSIWSAQRMHWMEFGAYTSDLARLAELRLVEDAVLDQDGPYVYAIRKAGTHGFVAVAQRRNSTSWSGAITVDEARSLAGSVSSDQGDRIDASSG